MVILIIYIAAAALIYILLSVFDGPYILDEPDEWAFALTASVMWPFIFIAVLIFAVLWALLKIIRAKHIQERQRLRAGK
jgi:hypothetical protein